MLLMCSYFIGNERLMSKVVVARALTGVYNECYTLIGSGRD